MTSVDVLEQAPERQNLNVSGTQVTDFLSAHGDEGLEHISGPREQSVVLFSKALLRLCSRHSALKRQE